MGLLPALVSRRERGIAGMNERRGAPGSLDAGLSTRKEAGSRPPGLSRAPSRSLTVSRGS